MSSVKLPCALPLRVAPEAASAYERLAYVVRDQTLALYAEFLRNGPSAVVDDRQWKSVKRRDGAEVFVARNKSTSAFHAAVDPRVAPVDDDWVPQVRLRVVGQMPGVLTDAVYGAMAPSETALLLRSTLTSDEYVDHKTLVEIRAPTIDAPLTHTALKWSAKATAMASLVKARDVTYVDATGFATVQRNGAPERVGYVVSHSLTLPELPSLESQGFVRSRSSICTLFRQAAAGVVEIFTTAAISPGGDLPSKLTTKHATEALVAVCKLTEAAAKRKLVWMQAAWASSAPKALAQLVPKAEQDSVQRTVCGQCARSLKSATCCEVCEASVCARCVTSQKLWFIHGKRDIRQKGLSVCKACSTMAQRGDVASGMAAYEFVHQPRDAARAKAQRAAIKSRRSSSSPSDSSDSYVRSSCAPTDASTSYVRTSRAPSDTSSSFSRSSRRSRSEVSLDDVCSSASASESFGCSRIDEGNDMVLHGTSPSAYQYETPTYPQDQKLQLWQQMNELCLQAEHTYYQTQQHNTQPRFEQRY